jgi:putative sigma-54 modulation protein
MTMQVEIRCLAGRLSSGLAELTEHRLQRALGRFATRVRRVRVCLNDVNGPRGGVDKRCRMRVDLFPRGLVVVEAVDAAFEPALLGAAERIVRRVHAAIERKRDAHRRRRPADRPAGLTEDAT